MGKMVGEVTIANEGSSRKEELLGGRVTLNGK